MHSLSPETDNCPSWISRRERMTVENISWSISMKECCRPRRGLNLLPYNQVVKPFGYNKAFVPQGLSALPLGYVKSNDLSSETTWLIFTKFHIGHSVKRMLAVCANGSSSLNKIVSWHLYGDNVEKLFFFSKCSVCLCWGFTAQSTQWGHVQRGQFT